MNEHVELERTVARHLAAEGVSPPSDAFYDELFTRAAARGPRPEWLALIKEPPMRTNSHLAVGSPTARVAAVMIATLLLAVALAAAGVAGQRLLAATGPIVVAQDGSGTVETIGEAVAMAQDGDEILVRRGTYVESIVVRDIDLTITGDGSRDEVVVEAAATEPLPEFEPLFWSRDVWPPAWAFILADTDTELSNLTVRGPEAGIGIASVGADASTTLEELTIRMPVATGDENPLSWNEGAGGVLRESLVEGWISVGPDAQIVIEDNELPASCIVLGGSGTDLTVRNNVIHGCPWEQGINVSSGNDVLIEGNDIWVEDAGGYADDAGAIHINIPEPYTGGTVTVRDNDVHDSLHGITVEPDNARQVEIVGNRIHDNTRAATSWGIYLRGPALLSDNVVSGNANGVRVAPGVEATLEGNTICDNGTNLFASEEAIAGFAASNEICEDVPPE